MHKYLADGSLGSSWHPYVHGDVSAPPIQEDETALTLFMFSQFYGVQKDSKLLTEFYDSFIKKMADFLADYIDESTCLPKPSYDLWEENFMTTTYTTAVVYGALLAAAELAETAEDSDSAVKWRSAADDIQQAAHKHLYNRSRQVFYKGIRCEDGRIGYDETIDNSSFFGAFMFGLFSLDSDEVKNSFETLRSTFKLGKHGYGLPRYEHDNYHRTRPDSVGNPWFIPSLWAAQYANETGDDMLADEIVSWVHSMADESGMLGEQFDPDTGVSVSVSPLVWTHAEYMATLLDISDRKGSK